MSQKWSNDSKYQFCTFITFISKLPTTDITEMMRMQAHTWLFLNQYIIENEIHKINMKKSIDKKSTFCFILTSSRINDWKRGWNIGKIVARIDKTRRQHFDLVFNSILANVSVANQILSLLGREKCWRKRAKAKHILY